MAQLDRRNALKLLGAGSTAVALGGPSILGGATPAAERLAGPGETLHEKIAKYLVNARFEDMSPAVIRKAKEQIVYFFGRAFEVALLEHGQQMLQVMQPAIPERGGASVIGQRLRLTPSDAAFANATLFGGSVSKDDVLAYADIHAGVITLPAALSIGEMKRASGRELLLATVLGYEVLGKLGRAAQGWKAPLPRRQTNIFGGYGPVTVAARLLALDRTKMANALGYAAHLCMGLAEGSMMDYYYALISRNGTFAAQLAEAGGVPYSKTTLEGELGLYRSFFGKVPEQLSKLIGELGYSEILNTVQKRYRGTVTITTAVELFADIVAKNRLGPDDVSNIQVAVSPKGSPEREREVSSRGPFMPPHMAPASLRYSLSRVLLDGKIDPARFEDWDIIADDDVVQLMRKVDVVFEPGRGSQWARLTVRTVGGRKIERESDFYTFPFPPEDWGDWLRASGTKLLPAEQLTRLEDLIHHLEDVDDVSKLLEAATPPSKRA